MDKHLSSLVSLWPVEFGALIRSSSFAYLFEPKPFVGRGQPPAYNFST
jgi:hypothetical protein